MRTREGDCRNELDPGAAAAFVELTGDGVLCLLFTLRAVAATPRLKLTPVVLHSSREKPPTSSR